MPDPDSPSPVPIDAEPSAIADDRQALESDESAYQPRKRQRWSVALGIILLIVGAGFGWRWWHSRANDAPNATAAAAGQPQGVPVKLSTIETATIQESSEFVGALEAQRSVVLKPEIDGRVSQIFVAEGDRVPAGKPLVQLSREKRQAELAGVLQAVNAARATRANAASQIKALEAERASRVAEVELQQENLRRTSTLVQQGALPRAQLDQVTRDIRAAQAALNASNQGIQAAQASLSEAQAGVRQAEANANLSNEELKDATIIAPIAGVVGLIPVKLGDYVKSGDTIATVTQNQALDLRLSIPLERGPDLRLGQRVEGKDSQGKVLGTGQISFISPRVTSNSQSIQAKASFDNSQGQLRDGQFIKANLIWQERPGVLIPTSAISRLGGATFVFVAQTQQPQPGQPEQSGQPKLVAKQKPVKLGQIQKNNYQVLEGLEPGEKVIISGLQNLSDGAPILPESK